MPVPVSDLKDRSTGGVVDHPRKLSVSILLGSNNKVPDGPYLVCLVGLPVRAAARFYEFIVKSSIFGWPGDASPGT